MIFEDMNRHNVFNKGSLSSSKDGQACKPRFRNPMKELFHRRKHKCSQNAPEKTTSTCRMSVFSVPISCERSRVIRDENCCRQFLDLTEEVPTRTKRLLSTRMSISNYFLDTSTLETADFSDDDDDDYNSVEDNGDSDDESIEDQDPWANANAALVKEVHEVSRRLEEELENEGIESPFTKATAVFPSFGDFHKQVGRELNDLKTETRKAVLRKSSMQLRRSLDMTETFFEEPAYLKRKESRQRNYLRQYFYEKGAETCSLPLVLAYGLEKRLSEDATRIAVDILHELTSPLRCFRNEKIPIERIKKRNE